MNRPDRPGKADRRAGVEMTDERLFAHRVRRLIAVSAVFLGVITVLAWIGDAPIWSVALLVGGWVLMPTVLAVSLRRPGVRYALVLPATLVALGLLGVVTATEGVALLGWALITAGILFGGTLGIWFWYRWAPVPHELGDPFGVPRITLVAIHVGLVLGGVALVIAATW
jgi:hypothetical protein